MSPIQTTWRFLNRGFWGRLIAAAAIGAYLVLRSDREQRLSGTGGLLKALGAGAILGVGALLPLELLIWRSRQDTGERLKLSPTNGCLLFVIIIIELVVFFMLFW